MVPTDKSICDKIPLHLRVRNLEDSRFLIIRVFMYAMNVIPEFSSSDIPINKKNVHWKMAYASYIFLSCPKLAFIDDFKESSAVVKMIKNGLF